MIASQNGGILIASSNGDLRMYKQGSYTKANVLLRGFGEAVTSLDVTLDSKWALVTCKSYLLLFNTEMTSGKTGFEGPMPK